MLITESLTYRVLIPVMMLLLLTGPVLAAEEADEGAADPHAAVFEEDDFPSASKCESCHQKIYQEWSSSAHAYASISPMFHKFEQTINNIAPTIGNFCVRCHASVGTSLGEDRATDLWERSQVSREGITCVTCHRVKVPYGKVNGERRMEPGRLYEPVYGATDGKGLDEVLEKKSYYKVKTDPKVKKGKAIHTDVIKFEQLDQSEFCVSCHQVAVNLGIKLEVVWDQYRASPAAEQGVTCQECHMGKVPGKAEGYEKGPVAIIRGKQIEPDRDHHNHAFYGPGYSIAHPGIFPHNFDNRWTVEDWMKFDYRAGWGSPEFEEKVDNGEIKMEFPAPWDDLVEREEAYQVILTNIAKNEHRLQLRAEVMEAGTKIEGPFFDDSPVAGKSLSLSYDVRNISIGHNIPSGSLGAQPELWLNVALADPDGKLVWESGYTDENGDMADLHSLGVRAGTTPHDDQLFNLQTKFLTTNLKGTDREMYLPVNVDVDQAPFLRPASQPTTVMNHPPLVRMEGRSIPPLGKKTADYTIPASALSKPGKYKLAVRLRSRAEPIYFMKFVGATDEMIKSMNEWMLDIHPYTVEFEVKSEAGK